LWSAEALKIMLPASSDGRALQPQTPPSHEARTALAEQNDRCEL
jgi:hypothetical protein